MKICVACGSLFTPSASFHRLCWDCWREERNTRLREEGWIEGYRVGRSTTIELSDEFLLDLIRLCHPDRHPPERAALANRVTQELLARRGK